MKHVVVRYRLKPECVEAHEKLIRAVFAELKERAVTGVDYRVTKLDDGVSYIHVADVAGKKNPLVELASFTEFTREIGSRCAEPPKSSDAVVVGSHVVRSSGD